MSVRTIRSVLVVDDSAAILRSARRELGTSRQVAVASYPTEAIDIARREPLDLAVVDVYLGNGETAFSLVRELKRIHPKAVAVMMSGLFCTENTRAAFRAGAHDCIDKPFVWREVVMRLENGDSLGPPPHNLPSMDDVAQNYYASVIAAHGGNVSAAARTLGIRRTSLQRALARRRVNLAKS